MCVHSGYGILIRIVLISGILIAKCSDQVPADTIPTTTRANEVKYGAGDIIVKTESTADKMLYVIPKYDKGTDEYERAWSYKNSDGSWGYRTDNRSDRPALSMVYQMGHRPMTGK